MKKGLVRKVLAFCITILLILIISPIGICIDTQKDEGPSLIDDDIE